MIPETNVNEGAYAVLDRPWARIADPTPIPADVDAEVLGELGDQEFAELLRDNLLPREPAVSRSDWEQLWQVLLGDDDLADRAFDLLEEFLEAVADVKAAAETDPLELKRATKFEINVQAAWARLERTEMPSYEKIRRLVFAITRHRAKTRARGYEPTKADLELWSVLGRLGMDPDRESKK